MARMIVIYPIPADPEDFDRHYFDIHVPLALKLPGLRRYEVNAAPVMALAGGCAVHRIGILYWDDMAAMRAAFASPEGQAAAEDRRLMAPDGSGVEIFLFEDRPL